MTRREDESLGVEGDEDAVMLLDQTKHIWQCTLGDIAPFVAIGVGAPWAMPHATRRGLFRSSQLRQPSSSTRGRS
jgi:hypothetical protein